MTVEDRVRELEETLRGIGHHARSGIGRLEHAGADAIGQQMFRHIAEQYDEVLATSPSWSSETGVRHGGNHRY